MKKVILGSLAAFIGFQAHAEVSCKKLLVSDEAALRELIAQNFPDLKVKIETNGTARQVSLAFEKSAIAKLKYDVINKAIEFRQDRYDNAPYSKRASSREYDATLSQRSGLITIAKLGNSFSESSKTKGAVAMTTDGREALFHEPARNNYDHRSKTLEFVIDGAQTISSAGDGRFIVGTKFGEIYLIDPVTERMIKTTIGEAKALKDNKDLPKTGSEADRPDVRASNGKYVAKLNEGDGSVELARVGSEAEILSLPINGARAIRSAPSKGQFIVETRMGEVLLLDAATKKTTKIDPNAIVDVDVVPQTKLIPLDAAIIKEYGGDPDRVNQFMIETDRTKSPIVRITQMDGTVLNVELWKLFK